MFKLYLCVQYMVYNILVYLVVANQTLPYKIASKTILILVNYRLLLGFCTCRKCCKTHLSFVALYFSRTKRRQIIVNAVEHSVACSLSQYTPLLRLSLISHLVSQRKVEREKNTPSSTLSAMLSLVDT